MIHRLVVIFLSAFLFLSLSPAQKVETPPYLNRETPWADSVFLTLSEDEKIGQLFNVAAYSNRDEEHKNELDSLIEKYHIGGLTFFQGGPMRQAKLTNHYQELSTIPLMIAIDGEWGLSMRLDSTVRYPWQMSLGAIQEDSLLYQMGLDVAKQHRRLGVHVNFAPVIDVNNNPKNPVIFARSFGEDKRNVSRKGIAYMKGMQDVKLLACAKHFPGHGDTDTDSHITLPIVNHDPERIDSIELYPFKQLIAAGVGSIMSAHLYLPQLTPDEKGASSLSPTIVERLLKEKLGFEGLVFTDGLNMGGVAKYQESQEIDLQALKAGNDILLLSQDVPAGVERIKKALADGELSREALDESVKKILKAKEWLGIHEERKVELANLYEDLNHPEFEYHNRLLVENSLTLLRNRNQALPIKKLEKKRIISVAFTDKEVSYRPFQEQLNLYAKVDTLHYNQLEVVKQKSLMDTLLDYDEIIISLHKSNKNPWVKAELNTEFKNFINILRLKKKVIVNVLANPYSLKDFLAAEYVDGLILSYQNSKLAQELSAQLIFGGIQAKGKLPVSISKSIPMGLGQQSRLPFRLQYTVPEAVGLKTDDLTAIDEIVKEGIVAKAFPGVQIYVAKEGKVIYHQSFGSPTYDTFEKVKLTDLYDLASVTKISSTLLAVMKLNSEGKLSLDDHLGKHLKMVRGTAYDTLVLRAILAHQAGLAAWIPFYIKTLHHGMPRYDLYSPTKSEEYSLRVAENLFITNRYRDTIFHRIINRAKINPKKEYRYSDIGYYFLKELVEEMTKEEIEDYNQTHFYKPMGMHRTAFHPREKFSLAEIVPTEEDKVFRKQLIHGDVHDPGAAMLGGVGGHAGLFSNANDLGKLMQLYLQEGEFAGERYLDSQVVEEYTKCQFCKDSIPKSKDENRRGAGFDKPAIHGEPGPTCDCISFNSFGHSGFTGTYAWVDPDEELVYIFLSNRVYPDAANSKLVSMNIRTRIQEEIYQAISRHKLRTLPSNLIPN